MDGEHKIFLDEFLLEGFIGELSFLDNLKGREYRLLLELAGDLLGDFSFLDVLSKVTEYNLVFERVE